MSSTAGAVYLARERQEVEDCPAPTFRPEPEARLERWPLTECMTDRALVRWWLILREFGLTH